jgi:hypothetical protein
MYGSAYSYTCVRILLYACPHTPIKANDLVRSKLRTALVALLLGFLISISHMTSRVTTLIEIVTSFRWFSCMSSCPWFRSCTSPRSCDTHAMLTSALHLSSRVILDLGCVCVCVCKRKRERERERESDHAQNAHTCTFYQAHSGAEKGGVLAGRLCSQEKRANVRYIRHF